MLHDLRSEIDRYLIGRASVQRLESWLVSHLQEILDSRDERLIDLVNSIDADLVELDEGLLSEADLRQHLDSHLRGAETVVALKERHEREVTTASSGQTIMVSGIEPPEHVTTIHLPFLRVA